jgi:DNA-binding XRE family transcriptional regulator
MGKRKRRSARAKIDREFRDTMKRWAGTVRAFRHVLDEAKVWGGDAVLNLRRELGLTQRQMADALGVDFTYLSKIERRRERLSANLILSLESFMSIEERAKKRGKWNELVSGLKEGQSDGKGKRKENPA